MKVTDLKTKELSKNAMERKKLYEFKINYVNVIFGNNNAFHSFLKSFLLSIN